MDISFVEVKRLTCRLLLKRKGENGGKDQVKTRSLESFLVCLFCLFSLFVAWHG